MYYPYASTSKFKESLQMWKIIITFFQQKFNNFDYRHCKTIIIAPIGTSGKYSDLNKTMVINIVGFELFKDKEIEDEKLKGKI